MSIEIESATDSPEDVTAAMGELSQEVEVKEEAAQESSEEIAEPEVKDDGGEDKDSEEAEVESKEADTEAADDESEEEETSEKEKSAKPKRKGGWQRKNEKLARELADKEREIEHWRKQALKDAQANTSEEMVQETEKNQEPDENDYEDHIDFIKAHARWEAKQEIKEAFEARDKEASEKTFKKQQDAKKSELRKHIEEFAEENPDFYERIEEAEELGIRMSIAVQSTVESDPSMTPQLVNALLDDLDEFKRINELGAIEAARAIGRIEAGLSRETKPSKEKKEIKTTKAPRPPKTIGSRASGSPKKDIYDEGISFREYEKRRLEQSSSKSF